MTSELSSTAISNLKTMTICSKHDKRQAIPDHYKIPDEATRRLRAELILEEALETIAALGFGLRQGWKDDEPFEMVEMNQPNLEEIIDGCCDLSYVTIGTLCSCGVPDLRHFDLVNKANEAKFPGNKATFNTSGKFLKPDGWKHPNHMKLAEQSFMENKVINLKEIGESLLKE